MVRPGQAIAEAASAAAAPQAGEGGGGRSRLVRPALHVVLALLAVVGLMACIAFVAQALAYPKVGYDFSIYFAAALALRDNPHANVYSLQVLQASAVAHHAAVPQALYLYPPVLAACLIPLTLLPYGAALDTWLAFCLILWLGGTSVLMAQLRCLLIAGGDTPAKASPWSRDAAVFSIGVCAFLCLAYGPLMQTFQLGQVTMLIFVAVAAVPFLIRAGHERTAGALLALATLLKLFPAVLILYFALRGRHRVAVSSLVAVVATVLALLPLLGLDALLASGRVLANGGANAQQFHNQSLARVPLWISAVFGGTSNHVQDVLGDLLLALVLVAFIGGMMFLRRGASRLDATSDSAASHREALGYAWALATMLLASPIVWEHYDVWLLPVVIMCLGYGLVLLGRPRRGRAIRLQGALCVAGALVSYALTANALPLSYDGLAAFSPGPYIAGHPIRPYFMLFRPLASFLLWLATGMLLLRGIPAVGSVAAASPISRRDVDGERPSLLPHASIPAGLLLRTVLALLASVVFVDVAVGVVTSLARASGGP